MLISFFFLPGLKDVILPHISLCLLNLVIPQKWMLYEMRSWHFSWDFFKLGLVSPQNALNNITKSGHSNLIVESPQSRERKIGFRSRRSGSEFHPGQWWAMPPGQGIQPRKQWVLVVNIWSSGANLPGSNASPTTCWLCDFRRIAPTLWSSASYLLNGKKDGTYVWHHSEDEMVPIESSAQKLTWS